MFFGCFRVFWVLSCCTEGFLVILWVLRLVLGWFLDCLVGFGFGVLDDFDCLGLSLWV